MAKYILVGTSRWRRVSPAGQGGVFRSLIDGEDWQHLPIGEGETQVNAFAQSGAWPGLVYACTSEGLFKSEDCGDTWRKLELPGFTGTLWSIAIHPHRPDTLFVGASPVQVFRSDDGGSTWQSSASSIRPERLDGPFHSRVMEIAIHPDQPDHVYAAMELNGVMRSLDGGKTWADCTAGLLEFVDRSIRYRNKVAVDDDREGILDGHSICCIEGDDSAIIYASRLGLFVSRDRGDTWADARIDRFSNLTYARDIQVSPHDPRELAVCLSVYSNGTRGSVAKSHDGGASWQRFDHGPELESTAIKLAYDRQDPQRLAVISFYGQLLLTLDGGKTFTMRSLPKGTMEGYSVAFV